jgi:hypothetical protein
MINVITMICVENREPTRVMVKVEKEKFQDYLASIWTMIAGVLPDGKINEINIYIQYEKGD